MSNRGSNRNGNRQKKILKSGRGRRIGSRRRFVQTASGSRFIGINNRDLSSMTTDVGHTLRLLDMVEDRDTLVSESGIKTPQDVERLRQAGVNRILVGEQLMRQRDVGAALAELTSAGPS